MALSLAARLFPVNRGKEIHVETIRGLACLALVSYHVVGSTPTSGLELLPQDLLVRLQECFADIRMPLFTFVSGYVFVAYARSGTEWSQLLLRKARRLLLPLLTVGTLFWLVRYALGYHQMPLYFIPILPYEHFWFLQSTFLLMASLLTVNALCADRNGRLSPWQDIRNAGLIGVAGATVYIVQGFATPHIFSIFHAIHLAPFFMAGHILGVAGKSAFTRHSRAVRQAAGAGLVLCTVLGAAKAFDLLRIEVAQTDRAFGLLTGLVAVFALFALRPSNRVLAWIGDKSYTIYLFHVFFTAAAGIFLYRLFPGVDSHLVYLPALTAGILGPIILNAMILRIPVAAWLFLGLRNPLSRRNRPAVA